MDKDSHPAAGSDTEVGRLEAAARAFLARQTDDVPLAMGVAEQLERHEAFALAWAIWSRLGLPQKANGVGAALPEWDGSSLAGRTILVENRMRHLGAELRQARLLALAAAKAQRCVAVTSPRLEPLLTRSFPEVTVHSTAGPAEAARAADWAASYETLGAVLAPSAQVIAETFRPLQASSVLTEELRGRYQRGTRPLVGVSWFSTNTNKDLPSVGDWAWLLSRLDADPVSLQYGKVKAQLREFKAAGVRIAYDPQVDPIADLEAHAAQVAAMDLVITISNTTAHMAGALGTPCIVVLDDKSHLIWPIGRSRTCWYPQTLLIRPNGRGWNVVMQEVLDHAKGRLVRGGDSQGGVDAAAAGTRSSPDL